MSIYETFDSIVTINLKNRVDKRRYIQNFYIKYNIPGEFYIIEKHPEGGRIGCFTSHINVIEHCFLKGDEHILIFEDDVIITPSYNEKYIKNAVQYMKKNPIKCQYLQLGYTILPHELPSFITSQMLFNNIIKYNGNTTHAYILNRNGMKRILNTYKNFIHLHIDIYYKIIFQNYGASVCPIIFDQQFCIPNDNDIPTSNYYKILRSISCMSTKYSIMYLISFIKYKLYLINLILVFIILCIVFIKCFMK